MNDNKISTEQKENMKTLKINDRVKVIEGGDSYFGSVGKIIKENNILDWDVLFNSGQRSFYDEENLEPVTPSLDTLLVGDIIEISGQKAKVLEVGVNSFSRSFCDFKTFCDWYTFEQAKKFGWKVVGQEKEKSLRDKVKEIVNHPRFNFNKKIDEIIKLVKEEK